MHFLFKLIDNIKKKYNLTPVIGIECEFFLSSYHEKTIDISDLKKIFPLISFSKEEGTNQFEFSIGPSFDIEMLVTEFYSIKKQLVQGLKDFNIDINFLAIFNDSEFTSGTHIHINFIDEEGKNIYKTQKIEENKNILYSVGGMLFLVKYAQHFLMQSDLDYKRLGKSKMSPSTISWGGNNRSVLIRIPDSYSDFRRLEFRLLSSNCNIMNGIYYVIYSAIFGMGYKIYPCKRVYGNAFDEQYGLSNLYLSKKDALLNSFFPHIAKIYGI